MNAMKAVGAVLVAGNLGMGVTTAVFEQGEGEMDFAFGKVVRVQDAKVVIMVFDFELSKDVEMVFGVDGKTVYEGYGSLEDVRVGDEIEIEYAVVNGEKIVQFRQ